jgi:hypothetical protein
MTTGQGGSQLVKTRRFRVAEPSGDERGSLGGGSNRQQLFDGPRRAGNGPQISAGGRVDGRVEPLVKQKPLEPHPASSRIAVA